MNIKAEELLSLYPDATTKALLDYLLIGTLSDNEEIRAWANEHLHKYAVMIKRHSEVKAQVRDAH